MDREKVILGLKDKNIGFSIHYATPVPLMSYYKNKYGFKNGQFNNAEKYGQKNISLPVHSNLNQEDIEYICNAIQGILKSES